MNITSLIENLFSIDQEIRKTTQLGMKYIEETDIYVTSILKKIVEHEGILTVDKVGADLSSKFVMLVQHSRDIEFAEDICKKFLNEHIDNTPKSIMPYLIDKIKVTKGLPQVYGTILETKFDENNEPIASPKPIEDEVNVNKRRADYGLDTLENYLKSSIEKFKTFQRK